MDSYKDLIVWQKSLLLAKELLLVDEATLGTAEALLLEARKMLNKLLVRFRLSPNS